VLSPRSRGKGGRRFPGRDGGRRKRKRPERRKQATHAVDELWQLSGQLVSLMYLCPASRTPAESIYLFDQRIARIGTHYLAELHGSRFWPFFLIRVPADCAVAVGAVIEELRRR
jgi:hypothetical protein